MTTLIVKRPQRRPEPPYPSGDIILDSPPELPKPSGRGWGQMMMMLPMLAGSVAMALMFAGQRGGPFAYVTGGLFGLSAIGMLASQFGQHAGGQTKQEMLRNRREYLRHLSQQRRRARKAATDQRRTLIYRHPHPQTLWTIVDSPRVWERRSGDGDFLTIRIGLGSAELATPIVPPQSKPLEDLEPMCALALRRFVATYTNVLRPAAGHGARRLQPYLCTRRPRRGDRPRPVGHRAGGVVPRARRRVGGGGGGAGAATRVGMDQVVAARACTRPRRTPSASCVWSRTTVTGLEAMLEDADRWPAPVHGHRG